MKYSDEYRDPQAAQRIIAEIGSMVDGSLRVMEFCGGHTHAIMRYGIRQALAPHVQLLSGPGCPVCVTADLDIDRAIALAHLPDVVVTTFGDMLRVPGTRESLQEAGAHGADVQMVYSALDAVELAQRHPDRSVVMLGIGFETTAPTVAASLQQARRLGLQNYLVYSMHKLTAPAMRAILDAGEVSVQAVLGPGHVAAITGWRHWEFLPREYAVPCTVSGFEPVDILRAIRSLAQQWQAQEPTVSNDYARGVSAEGNLVAQRLMDEVFEISPALWRGLGTIPGSGYALREEYADHDAARIYADRLAEVVPGLSAEERGCRCGEVLRGVIAPSACPLFGTACTPARPLGPCMVSDEGACAAHYRYGGTFD